MNMQSFGLTGRKYRPNYVGAINAMTPFLPQKKALKDEAAYRTKTLDFEKRRLDTETRFSQDTLDANKKAADTSAMIGMGQLGVSAYQGRKRDEGLKEVLSGGGGKEVSGTVTPTAMGKDGGAVKDYDMAAGAGPSSSAVGKTDFWSGLKGGAKNYGNIISSSLVGGTVGAGLGEKYVPIGGKKEKRIIGGAATAGALSYLSSGDPYTAGLSAIFGGALGWST